MLATLGHALLSITQNREAPPVSSLSASRLRQLHLHQFPAPAQCCFSRTEFVTARAGQTGGPVRTQIVDGAIWTSFRAQPAVQLLVGRDPHILPRETRQDREYGSVRTAPYLRSCRGSRGRMCGSHLTESWTVACARKLVPMAPSTICVRTGLPVWPARAVTNTALARQHSAAATNWCR